MLAGLRSNDIIVGAYSNDGGICPMLAAHRAGGRTNQISFAKAWDRFALGGARAAKPRRATPRELRVLITHLEASLLDDELPQTELGAAIASHKQLVDRGRKSRERPGDANRAPELRSRPGWAWTRLVRSYNEYERALEWLEQQHRALADHETGAAAEREPGAAADRFRQPA